MKEFERRLSNHSRSNKNTSVGSNMLDTICLGIILSMAIDVQVTVGGNATLGEVCILVPSVGNNCTQSDTAMCCLADTTGVGRCEKCPSPKMIRACPDGTCVCKGYPNPNVKEALLKGTVSLKKCQDACIKRKLCFGIEFWPENKFVSPEGLSLRSGEIVTQEEDLEGVASKASGEYDNCRICPTNPSTINTISVVLNPMKSRPNQTRSRQIIDPDRLTYQIIDPDRLNIVGEWLNWATVYGKMTGDNNGTIKPGLTNIDVKKQCKNVGEKCTSFPFPFPFLPGNCCNDLECRKSKCQKRRTVCTLDPKMCPPGWYCSGLDARCRKCSSKNPSKKCRKDLTSGVSPFTRAEPRKPCVHPVNSTQECKKAEAFFSDAAYVMLRDKGHGLPYGCISDKVTKGKHYLYWNSLGVTKSEDPNLQQICRTTTATNHVNTTKPETSTTATTTNRPTTNLTTTPSSTTEDYDYEVRDDSWCDPGRENITSLSEAKLQCNNDPLCAMFYQIRGSHGSFRLCDEDAEIKGSSSGAILHIKNVDCEWGEYGNWSTCSITCGGGTKTRTRPEAIPAANKGAPCTGLDTKTEICNSNTCPVHCAMTQWGPCKCVGACGTIEGLKSRQILRQPRDGGISCPTNMIENCNCKLLACPVPYFVKLGTKLCTGVEIIYTLEECKVAIKLLDLSFQRTESNANYPKGCYRYEGTKSVFWNTHSSGKESWDGHPICRKKCLPLSLVEGKCGPKFGGRCNKNLADWAVYCNLNNGWCGGTAAHRNAQSGDAYDWDSC